MAPGLEVVVFEKRGVLGLAAVRARGERQLDLVDADGVAFKLEPRRALYRLQRRVDDGDPRALKGRLRELQVELSAGVPPLDPDQLWERLEEERAYDLEGLTRAGYGAADDARVVTCAAGLCAEGRLSEALRLRPDGFRRTEARAWVHIRERRAREAQRRAAEEELLRWLQPLRARSEPGALAPPPQVAAELDRLRAWVLQGDEAPEARAARHLAGRLGLPDPDEALAELERLGLVPRHVNEVPLRHGLRRELPAEAAAAASVLAASPLPPPGQDLRGLPTVAIDDPGTREVDDALSAWEEGGALQVAVHIARVADCLRPGDALEREARRRATTVYFPGESLPMLPLELAEARWSLLEGQDRPALSLLFEVDSQGHCQRLRFARSTVRVGRQHGYEDDPADPLVRQVIARLLPLARSLRAERVARGAAVIELPHVKLRFDAEGDPYPVLAGRETEAHLVVSELMVLYNATLAGQLAGGGAPALFRLQPLPVPPPALPAGDPLSPVLQRRSLPPTQVGPDPGPHRTVGVEAYVQATSPIRRYGDLVAQRQLLALLDGAPLPHDRGGVQGLQAELERAERRARQAEDERERYLVCHWLARRQAPLPGAVTKAEARRVFAWIPELGRELPVKVEPGQAPPVGTRVALRVLRALPRQRIVDLELIARDGAPGV